VKTLLKSVHIYQSYCKKNLAQFFWPTLYNITLNTVNDKRSRSAHVHQYCKALMDASLTRVSSAV